ncbi:MAG: hypothetical protein IJ050_09770, partial [Clostridia bacterium]|nr:hypothetical protein [Clostridia bacterium]
MINKQLKRIMAMFLVVALMIGLVPFQCLDIKAYASTSLDEMRVRAEAIVNYTWTPSQDIATWNGNKYNGKTYFPAGVPVKGIPYTLFTSEVVNWSLRSLSEYKEVASSNYSATKYCRSVSATRSGPVYGSCCADMICEIFGGYFMNGYTMRYHNVGDVRWSSYADTTRNVPVSNIVAGDALSDPDGYHIIWVGEVTSSSLVIYEQTPPVAHKITLSKSSVDSNGYLRYGGKTYNIVTKCKNYTPVTHTCDTNYGKDFTAYLKNPDTNHRVYLSDHTLHPTSYVNGPEPVTIHEVYKDGCCKFTYILDNGQNRTAYGKIDWFKSTGASSIITS